MPILQSRMIALISAGNDYRSGLLDLCQMIREAQAKASGDPQQALSLLSDLAITASAPEVLLRDPVNTQVTLKGEEQYFKRNAKRNDAHRRWRHRQRLQDEAQVEVEAPKGLLFDPFAPAPVARAVEANPQVQVSDLARKLGEELDQEDSAGLRLDP